MSLTEFAGDFEAHLTVRCEGSEVDALAGWAGARGVKFSHIVLARGRRASQPMLTTRHRGAFADVMAATRRTARALAADGFEVVRAKVEAAPWNRGVPRTDEDAAVLGPGRYFEHHVKLLLPPGTGDGALADLVVPHAAHLSRNARRVRDDGVAERFVTQRCRLVGDPAARRRLDALVAALWRRGHRIAEVEREFVVHDSDESMDAGWIEETP
ncbi:hypothetical protein [Thermomonospora cellulosilytica]|uniref:Ankyrin n=1 Tax=Thermomonospora cellulosilytica TaxID=1411118 RepID=A0A7W3R942_9ACTN|nr:hypothetical protein [Thermomonospora cellulosilytica]MBA9004244.1 hypothetical protein [Thermomonospora cellulosilytica]